MNSPNPQEHFARLDDAALDRQLSNWVAVQTPPAQVRVNLLAAAAHESAAQRVNLPYCSTGIEKAVALGPLLAGFNQPFRLGFYLHRICL